jgi:hypothetical protein
MQAGFAPYISQSLELTLSALRLNLFYGIRDVCTPCVLISQFPISCYLLHPQTGARVVVMRQGKQYPHHRNDFLELF